MIIILSVSLSLTASLSVEKAVQIFQRSSTKLGHPCQVCVIYRHGNGCRGRSTNFILCSWNIKGQFNYEHVIISRQTFVQFTVGD